MFRHKGKNRTYYHNLRLASLLSFIAGIVNITGVLSLKVLTTNVTGHFAFFAENIVDKAYRTAFVYLIFIFCFLLGAFISNLIAEIMVRIKPRIAHTLPMLIETGILLFIGISTASVSLPATVIACMLLFSMGIQNALVTKISDSVVRTTHLTGLFTDLGIELSQLFFFKQANDFEKLKKSIYLRLVIITLFFTGCIIGGFLFKNIHLKTLLLAAICLLIALLYDGLRYQLYVLRRKWKQN